MAHTQNSGPEIHSIESFHTWRSSTKQATTPSFREKPLQCLLNRSAYMMQTFCSILKFLWQEFNAKLRYNFRKMLQNATLEGGERFHAFYNVYRTSEYFLTVRKINNRPGTPTYFFFFSRKLGVVACFVDERPLWKLSIECKRWIYMTLVFPDFSSNDFPETWLWCVLGEYKLIPEI